MNLATDTVLEIIAQGAKAAHKSEKLAGNVAGKIGGGIHTGMNVAGKIGGTTLNVAGKIGGTTLNVVKDTLKTSRERYLHVLHSQTIESKRKRQSEIREASSQNLEAAETENDYNVEADDATSSEQSDVDRSVLVSL